MLPNMDTLFTFCDYNTAKYRFNLYQGKQRAPDMMVNILLSGSARYNRRRHFRKKNRKQERQNKSKKGKNRQYKLKPLRYPEDKSKVPFVVFGNGMFGKDRVKLKGLRCSVAGDLLVLPIDEHPASKICKICKSRTLIDHPNVKGQSILVCKTCNTLWQLILLSRLHFLFV
ncbi:hypothetical protein J3Q64DRAFT_1666990 [Phycomyces blakesleeanus]|uniref:GATA-type zinc finger transcription factor n=1 Tax=Phycomyces blakesleeanus TaxID=4837 RepID=A0ABR3AK17_PHYBL